MREIWRRVVIGGAMAVFGSPLGCAGAALLEWMRAGESTWPVRGMVPRGLVPAPVFRVDGGRVARIRRAAAGAGR